MKVIHSNLGECEITEACLFLQSTNLDPSSCYVEHDGEIKEVTAALIRAMDQATAQLQKEA